MEGDLKKKKNQKHPEEPPPPISSQCLFFPRSQAVQRLILECGAGGEQGWASQQQADSAVMLTAAPLQLPITS